MKVFMILLSISFVFVIMLLAFVQERRTKNAGWVDVGWAMSIFYLAAAMAYLSTGMLWRRLIVLVLVMMWAFRLVGHILTRLLSDAPEDRRYQFMREALGPRSGGTYLALFMGEGLLAIILTYPLCVITRNSSHELMGLEFLGIFIALTALVGESIADWQLKDFISVPDNRGRVCDVGLWRYSRHPNYFFEFKFWVGLAVFAWPSPGGQWAWSSALIMLILLVKVTGIPHAERQALATRGEAYRRYMKVTSSFIPWIRKSE